LIFIIDFSLSDDEVSPADVLVSFVALSQRSLLHLEVGLEKSHLTNDDAGSGGGDENNDEQIISTLNVDVEDDGNSVANGDKRQQKSENLDRLDVLYRHWEGLSLNFEKQAENFQKRIERGKRSNRCRNAAVTQVLLFQIIHTEISISLSLALSFSLP
uniref:AATF-Che1 domain-containing protein n=1 Tax=Brugia pahangi TaxID=6280 RepID=A0A0N4T5Y5_BRUPA